MAHPRRSNRTSGARTKYIEDPFVAAGVSDDNNDNDPEEGQQGDSGGGDASVAAASQQQRQRQTNKNKNKGKGKGRSTRAFAAVNDKSSDEDFEMPDAGNSEDDDDDDEEFRDEEEAEEVEGDEDEEDGSEAGGNVGARTATAGGGPFRRKSRKAGGTSAGVGVGAGAGAAAAANSRTPKRRHPDGSLLLTGDATHSRGSFNPLEHVGKAVHLRVMFGTDNRDLLAMIYARERWGGGVDSTFPTREALQRVRDGADYGYGLTFGVEPDLLKLESARGWDWYYTDAVRERFRLRQRVAKLGEAAARRKYLARSRGDHTVLLGPVDDQKEFTLGQHQVLDFGDAWASKAKAGSGCHKVREGWLLNFGSKVQCLAWAPNQLGRTQYLAVVAPILPDQKAKVPDPLKDQAAPAFRPSAPYPCALQIWAFQAQESETLARKIDLGFRPHLRLALCTDWGDLRRLAWCPMPRSPRDEDDEDERETLGLLAGIWTDGYVRVIDVKVGRDTKKAEFYQVHSTIFEAKPPSTVCTCVTWLSPSDIAVGCANGYVAIWSIAPSSNSSSSPAPYFYQALHSTWVLNISSAYPTYPHLIATTSMDGDTRLTSVVDPPKDQVYTNRMRVGSTHLSYCPPLQSFLSSDENDFARLLAVRRFYTSTAVARLPSPISALAPCSYWHPSVLFGCVGGTVQATNPLRRVLHSKEKQWQQNWFQHEWVRGPHDTGTGVSRFYDGYRAESVSLLRNLIGDRKLVNGMAMITIYEEETHVTALSWNPNQACAGWAAAGLGCGLVRVEDLVLS
ncbi:transcription factor TFIIIC subunit TFC6 [Aspergillus brunneoviolaceus CBS 621.78]|uniref:Transcription factor TFIIIC complex subunit Tfc6 n=1 Tax=Aspergillus brunneoviolaceus CBS 621.78 TaxID=1450534 RepID=A0ACD1GFL0_9EURO|nr:transcription factor TFIIIC complex subunit Tfc6 [Aspergillus brunneoviolaceus CBS 621.78]RAH48089.1 transcription factor TFIIIC complex subunit Tfc6 [Aspergillus brunneoviolaceus CBS 621.78]